MKRGHDLSGIMKFATGPAWAEHLRDALGDHLGHTMEEFEFEADELADIVGDHWAGVLWGCAFEDLLTRDVELDGRNLSRTIPSAAAGTRRGRASSTCAHSDRRR